MEGGREARFDCPHCGNREGFNLNLKNGLWHCLRGSCGQSGNLYTLKVAMGLAYSVSTAASVDKGESKAAADRLEKAFKSKVVDSQHITWYKYLRDSDHAKEARRYLSRDRGLKSTVWNVAKLGWINKHPNDKKSKGVVGNGIISIPSTAEYGDSEAVLIKLRWIPPEPEDSNGKKQRYMRIAGGESILYSPIGLDYTKTCIITGGELDALSLVQSFIDHGGCSTDFECVPWCPVSVPGGEGSWKDIWTEQLSRFEDILILFDNDEAGRTGAETVAARLGGFRCRIGRWPKGCKDGNDALVAGKLTVADVEEIDRSAVSKASEKVISASSMTEKVVDLIFSESPQGWSTGWKEIDRLIGGWRPGEITVLTGHSGCGKTTLALDAMYKQMKAGRRCMVFPFEGGPAFVIVKLVRRILGRDPSKCKREEVIKAIESLDNNLLIMNHVGHVDHNAFKETINYCVNTLGVKYMVCDHLHFMTRRDDPQRWEVQDQIVMDSQTVISSANTCHMVLIAHPSSSKSQTKHKDDIIVQLGDIKGHTEVFQDVANVMSVYRPRSNDREDTRDEDGYYEAAVVVLKQRAEYGDEGFAEMRVDKEGARFIDYSDPSDKFNASKRAN
jgi:KaiC/GvpD/RAD55 family RecA-like ATPase